MKRQEPSFVMILVGDEEGEEEDIPLAVQDVLKSFKDVMLD